MAEVISHEGRILEITPQFTSVEIISASACSSCHAAGLCGVSDAVTKVIQIPTTLGNWKEGQTVDVCLKRSMGFKAVWLAYVIPLLVLLAVLLGLVALGVKEWIAGVSAVAAALAYYLVLGLFKDKLSDEYSFYIKEKI